MLKPFILFIAVVCVCTLNPLAHAQGESPSASETANAMCPIGKEPIVPSAGTVEYKGKQIGLCCPGCGAEFLAWDEARKDEFVALAIARREPGNDQTGHDAAPAIGAGAAGPTYPYTLPDCPVGGPLGSMGDPITKVYDNREVRFCCGACIAEFEADTAKMWGAIDTRIVAQQRMHYPIATCIVTGAKLDAEAINHVHNNRLVRLANAGAAAAFKADPVKHLAALDKKIIEVGLPGYPMDSCPVGGRLGSMGEPIDFIYMNRLVRFCCAGCEKSLVKEPAKYMAKLDKAYADAQRALYPIETCVVAGGKLGSMGEPVEVVAGTQLVRFCCASCVPKFKADPHKYLSKLSQE